MLSRKFVARAIYTTSVIYVILNIIEILSHINYIIHR